MFAATLTWSNGGDGLWSNTANWGGSTLAAGDALIFGSTAGTTTLNNDLTSVISGLYLGVVTFNADAPAYTIGGNAIIGNSTGVVGGSTTTSFVVNSASNITQTINNNFTLHQNAVNVTGTGNLTLTGTITKGGTWNPFIQMNGTGVLTLSGSSATNAGGSTNALTVNSGTVVLSKTTAGAVNTSIINNGGTIRLEAVEQLKAVPTLTMNNGILDLNGFDSSVGANGAAVTGTTGGITTLLGVGGRITNNASGSGTNWLVVGNAGSNVANLASSYGGTISDGATAKVGVTFTNNWFSASFATLSGNNTYSGGTVIHYSHNGSNQRATTLSIANVASIGSEGHRDVTFISTSNLAEAVLQLTGTAITNSNQFDTLTRTGGMGVDVADPSNVFTLDKNASGTAISISGAGVFQKMGAGTLTVATALTYTGSTALLGGTLKIDAQNGGSLSSSSGPIFNGGELYLLGKTTGTTTQTLGNVTLGQSGIAIPTTGASKITVDANGGGGTTLSLGTLPNSTVAGSTLNIKVMTGGQVSTTTTTTTNGLVGNGRILFTDATNTVNFASIPGSGTRFIQAATYTTGLPASGSTSTVNYSHTDNATVTASESVNTLKLTTTTSGQSLAISSGQTLTLTTGGLLFTGGNDYSISGGTLKSNTATNSDLIIHQYGAGNLTIGSVIANGNGASTLTKAGNGTLTLSGTNTYSGQTFVTGGILSISSDSNISGANGTFTGITSATNSASVSSNAASLPAGFGVGSTMLGRTVNGITGTSGTYTITLSGNANTAFTANSGVASWAHAPALGLYSGGILQATSNITLQEIGTGGSGSAATTTVNRPVIIGSGGGGFEVTGSNTLTIPGTITATGMMTKSGSGTLVLGTANIITGGLTIQDGTVRQTGNGSLSNASTGAATTNLIFGSGTAPKFQLNNFNANVTSLVSSNTNAIVENGAAGTKTLTVYNGADNTYAGKLQNGSAGVLALVKTGGGTLALTNTNTYTGTTTVSGGSLQVGIAGTGTTGTGAVTVQSGGTILGTGTVRGSSFTAQSGSTIFAGDTTSTSEIKTLTFTPSSGSGALDFQSASSVILGISPGAPQNADLLNFVGTGTNTLLFNGNLTIGPASLTPTAAEVFNLLDWSGLSTAPTFASRFNAASYSGYLLGNGDDNLGFDLPDIAGSGYGWDISQFITNGTISTIFVAPEPSRVMLLILGFAGLVMRRRRQ